MLILFTNGMKTMYYRQKRRNHLLTKTYWNLRKTDTIAQQNILQTSTAINWIVFWLGEDYTASTRMDFAGEKMKESRRGASPSSGPDKWTASRTNE